MEPKLPIHRGVYILPNLLTSASLFTGFLAIIWAAAGKMESAAIAILISAILDGLDGKVARLTNSSSEFGVQYDSLADLVAFGVAPGFLVFQWQLYHYGRLGIGVAFLYAACGALRLARFNISTGTISKKHFIGLPIPGAGCGIALLVLFVPYLPEFIFNYLPICCLMLTLVLAFLMVSRVRYFSFKEFGVIKTHPLRSMVLVLLLFVCVASEPRLLTFLLFLIYLISGPIYSFFILPRRNHNLTNVTPPGNS